MKEGDCVSVKARCTQTKTKQTSEAPDVTLTEQEDGIQTQNIQVSMQAGAAWSAKTTRSHLHGGYNPAYLH